MTSSNYRNLSSNLKQNLKGIWQTPAALSALASLGAHALLFSTLPFLSQMGLTAAEPEIREPVEVVELTPEEQRRLPDFATAPPPIQLPRITNPPRPGAKGADDPFALSPLPKPSGGSPFPSSIDSFFPPPPSIVFGPPTAPLILSPPSRTPLIIPSAPPAPARPSLSPTSPPNSAEASPETPPNPSAVSKPEEALPPVAVESGPGTPPASEDASSSEATSTESSNPAPRSEEQIRQDLIAEQAALRELYTYNPSGTSIREADFSFGNWFREVMGRDYSEGDKKPDLQEMRAAYPRQACPLQPSPDQESPHASVGVVVDANNTIISEPKVLQSSGYRLFNQAALEAVKTYAFENTTGEKQVYIVKVNFEYSEEICPPGLTPSEPTS